MVSAVKLPDGPLNELVQTMHVRNIHATLKHIDANDARARCIPRIPDTDDGLDRACRKIIENGLCWRDAHLGRPSSEVPA